MDRRRGRGQVSIGRAIVLRWAFLLFVGEDLKRKKTLRLKEPQRQDFMVSSLSIADSFTWAVY